MAAGWHRKDVRMGELQTRPGDGDVAGYLAGIADPNRRGDAEAVCALMADVTGQAPRMWGTGLVGFGRQTLRYDSGREVEWFLVGFAARKQATTVYVGEGFEPHADLLARLGPHSTGRSCLYIKRLADIDLPTLTELVRASVASQTA